MRFEQFFRFRNIHGLSSIHIVIVILCKKSGLMWNRVKSMITGDLNVTTDLLGI